MIGQKRRIKQLEERVKEQNEIISRHSNWSFQQQQEIETMREAIKTPVVQLADRIIELERELNEQYIEAAKERGKRREAEDQVRELDVGIDDVLLILGSGKCTVPDCEGCRVDARMAREALRELKERR